MAILLQELNSIALTAAKPHNPVTVDLAVMSVSIS